MEAAPHNADTDNYTLVGSARLENTAALKCTGIFWAFARVSHFAYISISLIYKKTKPGDEQRELNWRSSLVDLISESDKDAQLKLEADSAREKDKRSKVW